MHAGCLARRGVFHSRRLLLGHNMTCLVSRLDSHHQQSAEQIPLALAMLWPTIPCRHKLPLGTELLTWGQPHSRCSCSSQSCLLGRRCPHPPSSRQQQLMRQLLEEPPQAGRAVQAAQHQSCLRLLRLGRQARWRCRTAQQLGPLLTASRLLASCSSLCWLCGPSRALTAGPHG